MALPTKERELLIRIGLAYNDLLLLQRVWATLSVRQPESPAATDAHAIQAVSLLLILAGKVFEACEVFRRWFLSTEVGRDYLPMFSSRQKKAVDHLKALHGSSSLLATLRNSFAFHYHDAPLTDYLERLPDERLLSLYLGEPDANTLNAFAAEPFLLSLLSTTGKETPDEALVHIQEVLGNALRAFGQFSAGVQLIALRKMHGHTPPHEDYAIPDNEFRPQDKIRFPFFMGVPAKHGQTKR